MTRPAPALDSGIFTRFRDDDLLINFIGDIVIHRADGRLVLKVALGQGAVNPMGMLHGGAASTLFDVAMYEVAKAGGAVVTVAQEVKFLKPVFAREPLFVEAQLLCAGRGAVFCTGRAIQNDRLCAFATAQFSPFKAAAVTTDEGT